MCSNVCPKKAIKMISDKSGFLYPEITEACVDCNICEKACRSRVGFKNKARFEKPDTYASWSENEDIRYNSTSGGAFSELAKIILEKGGCVAGALYNENNKVEHAIIYNEEGLKKIRQSKYTQSDMRDIYKELEKELRTKKLVAFCGAPCQVAALYAYLKNDYDNLITFDFICRGMNSPKAYKAWLTEIENTEHKRVKKVWFKYKFMGWKKSPKCTRVDFEDGSFRVFNDKDNLFMKCYLGPNLYIRPSCGKCGFKGLPRQSDITLADFWGIEPELDDDKGTSMILVNSEKGRKLIRMTDSLVMHKRSLDEIFEGNVCFDGSVIINPKSSEFLADLDNMSFSQTVKKYTHEKMSKKLYHWIRNHIKRAMHCIR